LKARGKAAKRTPTNPGPPKAQARILARLKRAWSKATKDEREEFITWTGIRANIERLVHKARARGFDEGHDLAKKPRKRGAYLFRKFDCEPAPLMLGFVLGPMLEENFRRALVLADGDFSVFFTRPISLSLLILAVVLIRDRHAAFYQEEARRVAVED